ncbi:MAG: D-glycero-beta-D-manno-heptose-7-phosphate kinase [Candidatus Cloacimonetes bacterium]|nr:D-glycero-beta-D-manno-heptose-7-phosphate kinase [Candidatus Cloacimonadota bacterium]
MDIHNLLTAFRNKRIIVIGDVMLDQYIWGVVERLSPEAPVPVIEVKREEYRLGGAANVALNLAALGAVPLLVGVTGTDRYGETIRTLLQVAGVSSESAISDEISVMGLFYDPDRPTTLKTRIGAASQQVVRLDYESREEIGRDITDSIIRFLQENIPTCDGIIFEDYNKGLITADLIEFVLRTARELGKQVAVDPKHKNFFAYQGVYIFKPNLLELEKNLALSIENEEQFVAAARQLQDRIKAEHIVITRGSKGLSIFDGQGGHHEIPAFAKEVWDVSGAGDTVISVLALASVCGLPIKEAAILANHAAGVVCSKHGTASATPGEIEASYHDHHQDQDAE